MPVALVETAALHHAPSHTDTPEISVLTAVHAANVLAYARRPNGNGIPLPPFDEEYLEKLGLPVDLNRQGAPASFIRAFLRFFRIPFHPVQFQSAGYPSSQAVAWQKGTST